MTYYKMFGFIKNVFIAAMTFFIFNVLSVNSLECVSLNNQDYKARTKVIDVNNDEPGFFLLTLK